MRATGPPVGSETTDVLLEKIRESSMLTETSECPHCRSDPVGIRIITEGLCGFPCLPPFLPEPHTFPRRQPPLEPRLHVEGARLVKPCVPSCNFYETGVIVADQSDNPSVHLWRDSSECPPPVLHGLPATACVNHDEECLRSLHRSKENDGDHDRHLLACAVQRIGNGNERCGGWRNGRGDGSEDGIDARMESSSHAFTTIVAVLCGPPETLVSIEDMEAELRALTEALATTAAGTDCPTSTARRTLPPALVEMPHMCVATGGFGMQQTVTRELPAE